MEFLEVIESIRAEEASVQKLFGKEGQGVRHGTKSPKYMQKLAEAARLVADVMTGRRPAHLLKEAMTTSDFPYLFGDILDRQLLAAYQETVASWPNYAKRNTVRDFRTAKRFGVHGGDQVLDAVPEQHEYPESHIDEDTPYSVSVKKYGRRMPFSWETFINDDLDALKDIPQRFGRAARRSEEKFVTGLIADANGPHAAFYTVGNANIVTGDPTLSITALHTGMKVLAAQKDQDDEPIVIDVVELVVPPALEIDSLSILNATQLWLDPNLAAGTKKQMLATENWMKNKLHLSVNSYLPIVSAVNGDTSWYLFANPDNGRPAVEVDFLRGHEDPEIFMKTPNAMPVGGGGLDAMNGDFETDSIEYKVRHVLGGSRMDPKMTVGSKGTG